MIHYPLDNRLPVTSDGYYGEFGGAYIPEVLGANIENLDHEFRKYVDDYEFQREFDRLLHYYVGRPTPLYYAERLSNVYGSRIYLKREDLNHTGAHKINNAIGQGLLAKRMNKTRLIAETGAGQHGVATATVAALLGMKCTVYMGAEDVRRQRPNVMRMRMLGAEVVAVEEGSATLSSAVDAALAAWCADPDAFYLIGSAVGPHPYPEIVARFQSVISYEMRRQLKAQTGSELPDYVIACIGGGSNAAGAFYHFIDDKSVNLVAVEAGGKGVGSGMTAASVTEGSPAVLHGSRTLALQDKEGNIMDAYSVSSGLDYPGIGPLQAYLAESGRSRIIVANDDEALKSAGELALTEGIIPALESSHALAALAKIDFRADDVVVVNLSGRGDKDMSTYLNACGKEL